MKHSGADWIKTAYKVEKMSELGEKVADMLGQLFEGIYHIDGPELRRVDWTNDRYIIVDFGTYSGVNRLATYDFDLMTALVVASHDQCIRIELRPHTFRSLRVLFHPRQRAGGTLSVPLRMPTLEDHVTQIRKRLWT